MATVIYVCRACGNFWPTVDQSCPKCGAPDPMPEWDKDFEHPDLDGFYDRHDDYHSSPDD